MFEISDFGSRGWYMYYLCSENKSGVYAKDRLSCDVARMSHVTRKPVL